MEVIKVLFCDMSTYSRYQMRKICLADPNLARTRILTKMDNFGMA